jgi:hypothetical protein
MELTDNKVEIIDEIIQTYAPQMYMLNEYVKKNTPRFALQSIRNAAKKLNRSDVEYFTSQIQKCEDPITIQNLHQLSIMMESLSFSKWYDWKSFAILLGYNMIEIYVISQLVSPGMKVLYYIKDRFPNTTIMVIKDISRSSSLNSCDMLYECIRNILNKRTIEQ